MKGVYKTESIRRAERLAKEHAGEDELIERAAAALCEIVMQVPAERIVILAGGGNNGSDALSLALLLLARAYNVAIYSVGEKRNEFVGKRLMALTGIGADIYYPETAEEVDINAADVVVDGLLGIGCSRQVEGLIGDIVRKVNASGAYVVAIDVPTGLDSDIGRVHGIAVRADETVTFIGLKQGLYLADGRNYAGRITLRDIDVETGEPDFYIAEEADVKLPVRQPVSNKGTYGSVKIIAGSPTMMGASLLAHESALAALRGGAGYAVLCVPRSLAVAYQARVKEEMLMFMPDNDGMAVYDEPTLDLIMKKASSIVLGPGMGKNPHLLKIISYLAANFEGTLVVDGDGLNALSEDLAAVDGHKCKLILTPHVAEFARLIRDDGSLPDTERTISLASRLKAVIAMKNATTVISDGSRTYLNITGSPAMAKAGSGDVLSGLTAALSANFPPLLSAVTACYAFGKAGERAAEEKGEWSVLASDIVLKF